MLQELSNGIKNSFSHGVLTPEIAFWKFRSPPELQLSKLNSLGSVRVHFPSLSCTFGSMRNDSRAPSWPTTLQPLCFGREPKAKVATVMNTSLCNLGLGIYVTKCKQELGFLWKSDVVLGSYGLKNLRRRRKANGLKRKISKWSDPLETSSLFFWEG
jgi:hypothetical protein